MFLLFFLRRLVENMTEKVNKPHNQIGKFYWKLYFFVKEVFQLGTLPLQKNTNLQKYKLTNIEVPLGTSKWYFDVCKTSSLKRKKIELCQFKIMLHSLMLRQDAI